MSTNQPASIAYDPDFDDARGGERQLSAKVLFVAGVVTALLILGTVGFFILLSILFL